MCIEHDSEIKKFVEDNIREFHRARLDVLRKLKLTTVLRAKNPYLFLAKGVTSPSELMTSILDAYLSSSEEGLFGSFFEGLARDVCRLLVHGEKSSGTGLDIEFSRDDIRYVLAIKSGTKWGNASQRKQLREDFKRARVVLKQTKKVKTVEPVLGIAYGRAANRDHGLYVMKKGSTFWEFISGDPDFYIKIVEPIAAGVATYRREFEKEKRRLYDEFISDFMQSFATSDGLINWPELVRFNSGPSTKPVNRPRSKRGTKS